MREKCSDEAVLPSVGLNQLTSSTSSAHRNHRMAHEMKESSCGANVTPVVALESAQSLLQLALGLLGLMGVCLCLVRCTW